MAGDGDSNKAHSPGPSADEFDRRVLAVVAQVYAFGVQRALLWHTDIANRTIATEPVNFVVEVKHDRAIRAGGHLVHWDSSLVEIVNEPGLLYGAISIGHSRAKVVASP